MRGERKALSFWIERRHLDHGSVSWQIIFQGLFLGQEVSSSLSSVEKNSLDLNKSSQSERSSVVGKTKSTECEETCSFWSTIVDPCLKSEAESSEPIPSSHGRAFLKTKSRRAVLEQWPLSYNKSSKPCFNELRERGEATSYSCGSVVGACSFPTRNFWTLHFPQTLFKLW